MGNKSLQNRSTILTERSKTIERNIVFTNEVWHELWKRHGDKWQKHVHDLVEKDLPGTDLTYWAKRLNRPGWEKLLKEKIEQQ